MANDHLVVERFRKEVLPNEAQTRLQGRPVFKELEVIEFRFAGDKHTVGVFPAHDPEPNKTRERGEIVTYAQAYPEQYAKFKRQEEQIVGGTPLSEAPFLTEARRRELRAINIHTVEALASVGGAALKKLGPTGTADKAQAQAYLDNAAGSANVTAMAAELAELRQQLADQQNLISKMGAVPVAQVEGPAAVDDEPGDVKPLSDFTDDELKAFIKENGGDIRGNLSHDTLIERAIAYADKMPQAA